MQLPNIHFPQAKILVRWIVAMILALVGSFTVSPPEVSAANEPSKVDYARQIRPLFAQTCFPCHGPDEASRKGGFRLDRADTAFAPTESGSKAIVPGDPAASELILRILTNDREMQMPPPQSGHQLTEKQKGLIKDWIQQGAKFDDHWSFRQIVRPSLPRVQNTNWSRNGIDTWIASRLEKEGIAPSPEASPEVLLRRLSLDLRGLPPSPQEVNAFLEDLSDDSYTRWVEYFLASPEFGERWGRHWLDLAHYADSDGYLGDSLRPYAWLYRDWVIQSINRDQSFDEFTIEQLAGDLLPDATITQKTATGFLRNTMRNTEAGVDLEEYRLKEIVDRVNTIGNGWLGLSLGCAECHSHKYDPISQREFYQLFSFFNDAEDLDVPAIQPGEQERYQIELAKWNAKDHRQLDQLTKILSARSTDAQTIDRAVFLAACTTDIKKRSTEQKKLLESIAAMVNDPLSKWSESYQKHLLEKPKPPSTKAMTVARRKETRESYIHVRGDYRNRGDSVQPGTPAVLPKLGYRQTVPDRLDFARWLIDPSNPLTPRVVTNQIWKHLFGRGLVVSIDNFGLGGEHPSHPELLDWLAYEWMEKGWSRKALIRMIVQSSTYRQSSHGRSELLGMDPENVLLSRQNRYRLEAESIRDVALASSGLIERRLGGPGILPPQPAYIASISRNVEWKVSTGADLYRRGMYILFRRATPYPMLMTFDAPDSSIACTKRERSNSPLQALTLLNDPVFFECAKSLGYELAEVSRRESFEVAIHEGYLRCLGRPPKKQEVERLRAFSQDRWKHLADNQPSVDEILDPKTHPLHSRLQEPSRWIDEPLEQAVWIVIARVLLNLDEFITRE